jgi:hypothetical protein
MAYIGYLNALFAVPHIPYFYCKLHFSALKLRIRKLC